MNIAAIVSLIENAGQRAPLPTTLDQPKDLSQWLRKEHHFCIVHAGKAWLLRLVARLDEYIPEWGPGNLGVIQREEEYSHDHSNCDGS